MADGAPLGAHSAPLEASRTVSLSKTYKWFALAGKPIRDQ